MNKTYLLPLFFVIIIGLAFLLIAKPASDVYAQSGYRPTPTPWLPMMVKVLPEANYHSGIDRIEVLPLAHCYGNPDCPWVGDLAAGDEVKLSALSVNQELCFLEGTSIQGWEVKGWASCYRIKPVQ